MTYTNYEVDLDSYKSKKMRKRKTKQFEELRLSDPELLQLRKDLTEFRKDYNKSKTKIKNICREVEKNGKKLNKRYAKRLRELGFKLESDWNTHYDVEFKGW